MIKFFLGRTRSQANCECDECDMYTSNPVVNGHLLCDECSLPSRVAELRMSIATAEAQIVKLQLELRDAHAELREMTQVIYPGTAGITRQIP